MLEWLKIWRARVILVLLALTLALTPLAPERWGDTLRFALPALGFGCALATGSGVDYAARLALLNVAIFTPKTALADTPINLRPNGETRGFPSGHSAGAAFGAASIVHDCARSSPVLAGVVVLAAGLTGASRVEAGMHNVWQVLAGWLLGIIVAGAFRRRTRAWWQRRRG